MMTIHRRHAAPGHGMVLLQGRVEREMKSEIAVVATQAGYSNSDILRAAIERGLPAVKRELGIGLG